MSIHRMEIVTGSGRRRRFSRSQKEEIVSQTLVSGATVAEVARRHDIERSLLYRWRRELGVMRGAVEAPSFLPVTVAEDGAAPTPRHDARQCATRATVGSLIEIDAGGCCVRVGASFDATALTRVLDVLEARGGGLRGGFR